MPTHRLNMEIDLQSLFGLYITWRARLYSLAETPNPPPPALDSYTRALFVSKDRRHLFVTPCPPAFKYLCRRLLYKGVVGWCVGGMPMPLITDLFHSWSVDISVKDDVTVTLLLGVSFMFGMYTTKFTWDRPSNEKNVIAQDWIYNLLTINILNKDLRAQCFSFLTRMLLHN